MSWMDGWMKKEKIIRIEQEPVLSLSNKKIDLFNFI